MHTASVNQASVWIPLVVAVLAASASIVAALLARRSAVETRHSQLELERLKLVEARVSAVKTEIYRPMVEALNDLFSGDEETTTAEPKKQSSAQRRPTRKPTITEITRQFAGWLTIIGSDDSVRAFHNLMQAAFHDAPGEIYLRLYADFLLAARRDMGDPATTIEPIDVLGVRITDIYDDPELRVVGTGTLQEVADRNDWRIPWVSSPSNRKAHEAIEKD